MFSEYTIIVNAIPHGVIELLKGSHFHSHTQKTHKNTLYTGEIDITTKKHSNKSIRNLIFKTHLKEREQETEKRSGLAAGSGKK